MPHLAESLVCSLMLILLYSSFAYLYARGKQRDSLQNPFFVVVNTLGVWLERLIWRMRPFKQKGIVPPLPWSRSGFLIPVRPLVYVRPFRRCWRLRPLVEGRPYIILGHAVHWGWWSGSSRSPPRRSHHLSQLGIQNSKNYCYNQPSTTPPESTKKKVERWKCGCPQWRLHWG